MSLNTVEEGLIKSVAGDELKEIVENADIVLYSIKGKLVYINSGAHVARFEQNLSKYKSVILRLRGVYFIDLDGAEALDEIMAIIEERGQQVCLTSLSEHVAGLLSEVSPHYRKLADKGLVFAKTEEALRHWGIEPQERTH
jgi:MFS superfamily sulfate permease-like transporter